MTHFPNLPQPYPNIFSISLFLLSSLAHANVECGILLGAMLDIYGCVSSSFHSQ